jgi:hypothetical protein
VKAENVNAHNRPNAPSLALGASWSIAAAEHRGWRIRRAPHRGQHGMPGERRTAPQIATVTNDL